MNLARDFGRISVCVSAFCVWFRLGVVAMIVLQLILILLLAFLLYRISGVKRDKPSKVTKTLPGPKGKKLRFFRTRT